MSGSQRRVVAVGLSLLVVAGLGACGSSDESSSSSAATATAADTTGSAGSALAGKTIADLANVPNAYISCLQKHYVDGLEGAGAKTFTSFGKFDPKTVQQIVEDAVTRRPAAAVVMDEGEGLDALVIKTLQRNDIPSVLVLAGGPKGATPEAALNFDYPKSAKTAADTLLRLMPDVKTVGFIAGIPGTPTSDEMLAGIKSNLQAHGVTVASVLPGQVSSQGGATAAQDMLQAHPDIQAIFAIGDDAALGATRAIAGLGKDVPVIPFFSVNKAVLEQIQDGRILFAMMQRPGRWADAINQATADLVAGEQPGEQLLPLEAIDKDNTASISDAC